MNQVSTARSREAIMRVEDGFRQMGKQIRRADDRLVRFARQKPLAAAFAALREQMASETPPEETKA